MLLRIPESIKSRCSGVKATYLLAVAFLEILRFNHKGGVIKKDSGNVDFTSLLTCLFKYMECPNLPLDLHQCFTAIVHCAFDGAIIWLVKIAERLCFQLISIPTVLEYNPVTLFGPY